MTKREISNYDDVIDSRDVIARIEELESDREALTDSLDDAQEKVADAGEEATESELDNLTLAKQGLEMFDEVEGEELKALKALQDEAEGHVPDWEYGASLIRESYFVKYCQQLVEDIGDMPNGFPSYIEIDWDATAHNLRVDYTEVNFGGVPYLVR